VLLVTRVVEGVGYLLVVVAAPALLVRLTNGEGQSDQAAALAGWGTVIPAGLAVGGAVGGMLAQAIGWRGWLGVTGALALLAAVAVAAAIPPDPPPAPASARAATALRASRPLLQRRAGLRLRGAGLGGGLGGPLLLAGGFCGLCLVGIAVVSLLPTFLVSQRHVGLGAAGLVALASAPGSLAASWLLGCGAGLRRAGCHHAGDAPGCAGGLQPRPRQRGQRRCRLRCVYGPGYGARNRRTGRPVALEQVGPARLARLLEPVVFVDAHHRQPALRGGARRSARPGPGWPAFPSPLRQRVAGRAHQVDDTTSGSFMASSSRESRARQGFAGPLRGGSGGAEAPQVALQVARAVAVHPTRARVRLAQHLGTGR